MVVIKNAHNQEFIERAWGVTINDTFPKSPNHNKYWAPLINPKCDSSLEMKC